MPEWNCVPTVGCFENGPGGLGGLAGNLFFSSTRTPSINASGLSGEPVLFNSELILVTLLREALLTFVHGFELVFPPPTASPPPPPPENN